MTKKAPEKAQPGASETGHHWRGGGVEPGTTAVHETAEAAASRAEGNAPVTVAEAKDSGGRDRHPGARAMPASAEAKADEAENAEEKRQAAAEEHADQPVKHAPHGRL